MQRRAHTFRSAAFAVFLAICFSTAPRAAGGEQPHQPANSHKGAKKASLKDSSRSVQSVAAETAPSNNHEGVSAQEVQLLKQQLTTQQEQIEQLRVALEQQRQMLEQALRSGQAATSQTPNLGEVASVRPVIPVGAGGAVAAPGLGGPPSPGSPAQAAQDEMKTYTKKVDALEKAVGTLNKGLGNFSLSGDVRVRYEPFIQEGTETRNRQRIRARVNLKGKISDDMFGEFSLASGGLDDPISTNQTLTSFYQRKPVGIDLAYLTINPKGFRALNLTGGKQRYPWYRTQLTFDNDLNPEGFSESISANSKSVLKNVTVVGFQMPFNEVGGGPDGFLYGSQLQLKFNAGEKGTLELYGAGIKISHPDPIAVAQSNKTIGGNSLTNTVLKDADGNVTGYAGQFLYFNAAVRAGYKMASRWPFLVGLDFVQNTQAATNQRKGYLAEASIGQEVNPKDVKFGYQYYRIEKDAVISAYNFSDLRTPTNVQNHVFFVGYQIMKNVSGEWTYLLGKKLNDPADNWLSRMQFDLVYKF
jgi:TolA-binding protein